MRFGWLILAAVMIVLTACSSGTGDLKPLPIPARFRATGSDCDTLRTLEPSLIPSTWTGTAEVYAVDATPVDEEYVAAMARKLGITSEPADEGSRFTVQDGNGSLSVHKSGMYVVYSREESAEDIAGGGKAPSGDEARHIAEQFLRNLDLPVPGDWAEVESIRRNQGFDVVWRPAAFREVAMPIPLMLDIWVENDGVVSGMGYHWQDLRPAGEYPLISEAEALKRLRNCEAHPDFRPPDTPPVDDARIEYAGYPLDGPYQYFVPLYHFSNNLDTYATPGAWVDRLNKGLGTTDAWVLAIADEYIEAPPSE